MAETKYDLLLCPTMKGDKVYPKPWYKERLREKYIKSMNPNGTTKIMDSKNWTFLRGGLDDFRNGLPPPVTDDIFVSGRRGLSPVLTGTTSSAKRQGTPKQNNFTKYEMCYSRVSPMQKQRLESVELIERALKRHPLALYPHLEECLPPELFEDVIGVLDPEMVVQDSGSDRIASCSVASSTDQPAAYEPEHKVDDPKDLIPPGGDDSRVRNPYRWLPESEEQQPEKRDKKSLADQPRSKTLFKSEDDEHIKTVTQEFCEWVASLGGDSNNIDESTITSLFASGYETKPALSVPIHVVELANVPAELRLAAAPQQVGSTVRAHSAGSLSQREAKSGSETYRPSWVKHRYGAWYLEPKLWKRQPITEPLKDPNDTKDKEMSEAKQKSLQLDYDLAPMHGVKLFKDFVEKKDTRRPDFLDHVTEIQAQQQREEQENVETDQQMSQRHSSVKTNK